jgi:hypothetical protein
MWLWGNTYCNRNQIYIQVMYLYDTHEQNSIEALADTSNTEEEIYKN